MNKYILSTLLIVFLGSVSLTEGYAADYSIKKMTPAVGMALENRRERFDQLRALKDKKSIGENNQGYISVFEHDASITSLIKKENADRKTIYQAITEQNELGDAINVVEQVFARVQRDKAQPGDKIQLEDGSWATK